MYKLKYFKQGKDICGSDLENKDQTDFINLQQVYSLSELKKFHLPLSGTYKGDYAVLSMQNGGMYFLNKKSYEDLTAEFNINN